MIDTFMIKHVGAIPCGCPQCNEKKHIDGINTVGVPLVGTLLVTNTITIQRADISCNQRATTRDCPYGGHHV